MKWSVSIPDWIQEESKIIREMLFHAVKLYSYSSSSLHILIFNMFLVICWSPVLMWISLIFPLPPNFERVVVWRGWVVEQGVSRQGWSVVWLVGQGGLGQGWAVVWLHVMQSIPGLFPTVRIQLLDSTLQQGQFGLQFELRVWLGLLETGVVQQGSWGGGGRVL